jgi:hypothetical protein
MPDEFSDDLEAERGVNEEYLRRLQQWHDALDDIARKMAVPQNTVWGGRIPSAKPAETVIRPLIGRVGLDHEDDLLGRDFYIGGWYREFGGVVVINWAAEAAGLFFEGRGSSMVDPAAASFVGRRSFESRGMDLTGYSDELEPGMDSEDLFPVATGELVVPPVPGPVDDVAETGEEGEGPDATPAPVPAAPPTPPPPPRPPAPPTVADGGPENEPDRSTGGFVERLRNEELVRKVLERPRGDHLSSVLNTLQPDQYRLVSWPADRHMVVQGHPGTGKTIVATHRAAYLTHPARDDRLERVALVGPTDEWAEHVRHVIDDLGGTKITVVSLEQMVREFSGGAGHALHHDAERWFHVSWETARIGRRAVAKLKSELDQIPSKKMRHVLDHLVRDTPLHRELVSDESTSKWLLKGRSGEEAMKGRTFLLLMANIGRTLKIGPAMPVFDHVIVDEVQDVRGGEWRLIASLIRRDGHFSLFGDLNQRRTNHTWSTWTELVSQLEISGDPEFKPEEMLQGYRSTRQILDYASHLLEAKHRHPKALRDGWTPLVQKVKENQLSLAVRSAAIELCDRHPDGKVAVIAVEPADIRQGFLSAGWRKTAARYTFGDDNGRKVAVYKPVMARGLEFDGVVVVEPVDFPENLGKNGRLYTALTRANKELTVVHSKPLPRAIKGKGRKAD